MARSGAPEPGEKSKEEREACSSVSANKSAYLFLSSLSICWHFKISTALCAICAASAKLSHCNRVSERLMWTISGLAGLRIDDCNLAHNQSFLTAWGRSSLALASSAALKAQSKRNLNQSSSQRPLLNLSHFSHVRVHAKARATLDFRRYCVARLLQSQQHNAMMSCWNATRSAASPSWLPSPEAPEMPQDSKYRTKRSTASAF
mmetsp:Transcript_14242/g.50023  ORF Transcript_14242/g.50023 Transcript_14242/m.50023 type:complete len:204 (+) Transcript_14242:389-1000(+)